MKFIFCVFFLCLSGVPDWAGPQGLSGQELSDDDIIEALALLLSETEDGQDRRRGRQEFAGGQGRPVFNLDLDDLELDRASAGRQLSRQDFEDVLGKCTTTGYEVSTREECEEVNEIKCTPINVTKYDLKIVTRCETQIDKKCNITYIDVPAQDCKPRPRNRCETLYKHVEDIEYREECAVDVQHMCEHHVPVPVPVEVPYPVPQEPHQEYQPPDPPPIIGPQLPPDKHKHTPRENYGVPLSPIYSALSTNDGYLPPAPLAHDGYLPPAPPTNDEYLPPPPVVSDGYPLPPFTQGPLASPPSPQPLAPPLHQPPVPPGTDVGVTLGVTTRPPMMPYQYDPTPGPRMGHTVSSIQPLTSEPFLRSPRTVSPLAQALFEKLNTTRSRRSVVFNDDDVNTSEEQLIRGLVRQILDKVLVNNQELNKVKATIRDSRSINPVSFDLNVPQSNHLGGQLVDKYPPPSHPPHPPAASYSKEPIITTHELPAPEGCRSFATKECHKIPIVVPRKIPYEVCELVPDVECVNVLKRVPELQCTPEIFEDCNDVEKKVPYLVPEEDCVEVTFDECQEITERVPVELCKRKRLNEDTLTLSKGKVERKEGEKRRTPAFRRGVRQKNKDVRSKKSDPK